MPYRNIVATLGLLSLFTIAGAAFQAKKRPEEISPANGKGMFVQYCAPCHGKEGRGNGPAAASLKKAPADLTRLAGRNGGKFPDTRVSQYISGQDTLNSHGTRAMPIWGFFFSNPDPAIVQDPTIVIDRGGADASTVAMRITNLTEYVRSIQAK